MTRVCCICNKVKYAGSWTQTKYMNAGQMVTHGYCPNCFDEVMSEIEAFMSAKHAADTGQETLQPPLLTNLAKCV